MSTWLPLYLTKSDLKSLSSWLSSDPNIALIVPKGSGQWRAVDNFDVTDDGRYCIFHKLSGPLPLRGSDPNIIEDPFKGWTEVSPSKNPVAPAFGPGVPAVYWLTIKTGTADKVRMSCFEWEGNSFSISGRSATSDAKKWWERLKRFIKKSAVKIPRSGPIDEGKNQIWAFPAALERIKNGSDRSADTIR